MLNFERSTCSRPGLSLSDRLEEEAQRNANAVTTSLKRTVRDAIEILGQEALEVASGKYPSNFPDTSRRGVWIDGPELSKECLRYMYRLLFLFYAEANPRLKLLDLKNPIYAAGYSLEALRELESTPLRTLSVREGSFLWKSLQKSRLIYSGLDLVDEDKGTGLRLPASKCLCWTQRAPPYLTDCSCVTKRSRRLFDSYHSGLQARAQVEFLMPNSGLVSWVLSMKLSSPLQGLSPKLT